MSITVKFFASLRDELGCDEKIVTHKDSLTIADVWRDVAQRAPPKNLLCARNHDYADFNQPLQDGDEVAFFPPVSGG